MTISNDNKPPLSYASSPHTRDFIAAAAPHIPLANHQTAPHLGSLRTTLNLSTETNP